MSSTAAPADPVTRTALALAPRWGYLALAAAVFVAAAAVVPDPRAGAALAVAAVAVLAAGGIAALVARRHRGSDAALRAVLAEFVAGDAAPSFTTDALGEIASQNRAALDRFGARAGQSLARALGDLLASPAAVLHRLQDRAEAEGTAREDVVTRRGHLRLAVHRIGAGGYLWRLEDLAERATGGRGAETISLPMLTVSRSGTILFMNEALRRLVGERVKTLDRIFAELPLRPGEEHEIMGATGKVRALVAEVEGPGGRREIYLLPGAAGLAPASATMGDAGFEALPVALVRLSAQGMVTAANRAARAVLGEGAQGRPLAELVEGLGRPVGDWLADALAGRAEGRPEVLRVSDPDREVFLQVTLARMVEAGRTGLVAVLSDATQLKTLEAQFVQSQKMQAIGQLAGGVAHDFNNLLTAISGHCDLLLLRHGDKDDVDYGDLTQIAQNANRAASLVGQLLAFSRKQTLQPAVIDLRDSLGELTHLLNRLVGEKVTLTLDHDPDLRQIRADKRQLEQVIMNLVVNARDAMPKGGAIRIETENRRITEELRRDRAAVPPGDWVVVKVTDAGTGIPADKLQKIFEPFYTTKRQGEGTGLGLSTAYGIVKQTGGFIFVDSVVGTGTTFSLWFPAFEPAPGEVVPLPGVELPAGPASPARGEGVILLVEDEAPVRAFAARALQMRGYTVIEAEDAEQALERLADPDLAVDLFVTDVIMPGMDGPTWVREALKTRPDTRVVFVSGYAEDSFQDQQARIPNSVFLPKPFSLSELTATVAEQLAR